MAAITNLSFEASTDGVTPDSWTVSYVSSVEEYAAFGGGVVEGFESGWGETYESVIVPGTNAAALQFHNTTGVVPIFKEGFELGWNNDAFTAEVIGELPPGSTGPEDFESWAVFQRTMGTSEADLFTSGSGREDFETGWRNDTYAYVVTSVPFEDLAFAGARGQLVEGYEYLLPNPIISFNLTTGLITLVAHPFSTGFTCQFNNDNGQLPGGIVPDTPYAITKNDANSFYVTSPGAGSPVIPTNAGTGATYLIETTEFWTVQISI